MALQNISLETKCIHLEKTPAQLSDKQSDSAYKNPCGNPTSCKSPCKHYGAVSFPIYQTATYAHPGVGMSTGFDYSRLQNPTREQLEKIVCQLEGGIDAFALSSGMAAISLLMELFNPGDHIIADSDLYGGTIRLFDNVSVKNGIQFTRVNCSQENLEPLIKENTRALYIETPTNPMMNITDIAKASEIAHRHNLLLIVDNTFMSPYFLNPLALGADIVVHSGTKYLAGHNDTLAGFIIVKDSSLQERLRFLIKTTGAGLAPFDCWLVLRGIKTLAVRMEKAQENALKIAEWLKTQKAVKRVLYPGLKEHPGYEIQKKQSRGFGAMLTFQTDTTERAFTALRRVNLIQYAESLGGVETLITYPTTQTHADVPEEIRLKNGITPQTLRLSVGIENADDLIADLEQALKD
ncbi:PLP-dependent aspartate aminotransferase family protein [Treponema sp.]|uniref:trans-sulfuration enzyme family protein n=1 Tax=Treponema sp. TaxID=166 RepID=UPI00298DA923|nr:PLP-dependent aspartate aminotransferase family protein [Treponema sp.]MCR5614163.1 PLP-dependent aspartate aminotransferase family protein [Treponema sp.]